VLVYSIVGIVRYGPASLAPDLPDVARNEWTAVSGGAMVGFVLLVLILVAAVKVCQSGGTCVEVSV